MYPLERNNLHGFNFSEYVISVIEIWVFHEKEWDAIILRK